MSDFLQRLKQRKLVQWALAYIAAAFALIQVVDVVAQRFDWPDRAEKLIILALAVGFFVVLVLAWYHGEKGRQRVSGAELLLIALVLAVGGAVVWRFAASRQSIKSSRIASVTTSPTAAAPLATQTIPAQSVAVLPFANLSGDSKQAYFSDGITVEILNALAQIPKLKVAGRTSAFAFKGEQQDTRKIGEVLGVAAVLEGSVQKAGDEVRITVQLVDTHSGYQLWSENYDRKLTNIFAIEDEISNAVADKLRVQWGGGASRPLVAQKVIDPRAHDFYLRGLTLLAARGPGLRNAVADFQNAVKIDPDYAQAWGALADAEVLLPSYGLADISTAQARATSFAHHALALNANTASAYGTLGIVHLRRWEWEKADDAFRRSLALAPSDAEATDQYAQFLYACGQFTPALAEIKRAQKLDPLSAIIATMHAGILFSLHRNTEADAQIHRALNIDPAFGLAHIIAAMTDWQSGRFSQALAHAERTSRNPAGAVLMGRGMADPGLRGKVVQEFETSPSFATLRDDPFAFAQFLALLGARDRALDALESLAADRAVPEPMQIWSPALDSLRNDPRFKAVLKKMGLPYTPSTSAAP
jgi:TolB-like protein/Tfp pilus assembly protein PilF